ncbi:response regulator [Paenibacillus methanolicus]|uniref:Two-component system response regulator YesN n=1 Tax=Paenibacillus methanolicus TaxID=582686 RepID=A0A5S5CAZ9_9BACL|nr:response regulator [Paenibacillus methanolicus]TYP76497.1 two-component system response regulator YesN [Paenibacillus methanolicus]
MIQILIVDDEIHAVRGLEADVNWDKLAVSSVHKAYNARQAQEVLNSHSIDIVICDIEMPEVSGLQLMTWVKAHYPAVESIFLTCHSEFHYAKEAIHLGSLEYLLKPAPVDELERAIGKAAESVRRNRRQREFQATYEKYAELWSSHQPLLVERFWSDLLHQRIPSSAEAVSKAALQLTLPFEKDDRFLPVYIQVDRWHREWSSREASIMEYALQNAAAETIAGDGRQGHAVRLNQGGFVAMLRLPASVEPDHERLAEACRTFIASCERYFYCDLSCYIGTPAALEAATDVMLALLDCANNHVALHKQVIFLDQPEPPASSASLPEMTRLRELLEAGQKDLLHAELRRYLTAMRTPSVPASFLHRFFHDFLQAVYYTLQLNGLQAHLIFAEPAFAKLAASATRSLYHLEEWAGYVIRRAFEHMQAAEEAPSVVDRAKRYIADHLDQNLTRELIANHVYLNPDYLARLFKRETGLSITDYLTEARMGLARKLLVQTELPVSTIAERTGIPNFSYFSKQFKRNAQMSPLEYRQLGRNGYRKE